MNIAFVNATKKWGGVKTWILDFAQELSGRGHAVFIYGRQEAFIRAARQRTGRGELWGSFGPDLNPAAIVKFYREFTRHAVDAVFVNIEKDLATAGVAARLAGIPVVQQIGLPGDIPYRIKTKWLHRFVRPHFLCSCRYIADGFVQSLPYVAPHDAHVVLTAKKASDLPIAAHRPRVLAATQQLNPDKGHEVLLRALASVDLPFTLHIAGTGSCERHLKNLADSLGLSSRTVWHGFVTDVPALLHQADIFLLASLSEGLPNTLQEALATGLLPIVRDVGGVREVLPPALEQWVVPYQADAQHFADAVRRALLLPDEELVSLREAARQACRDFCDLEAKTTELEAWLHEIAAAQANGKKRDAQ